MKKEELSLQKTYLLSRLYIITLNNLGQENLCNFVPGRGLEPPRGIASHGPKPCASTIPPPRPILKQERLALIYIKVK